MSKNAYNVGEKKIPDEEWEAFLKWWKGKWLDSPDRLTIEIYLEWRDSHEKPK